jgi:hypothetical protein
LASVSEKLIPEKTLWEQKMIVSSKLKTEGIPENSEFHKGCI